MQHSKQQQQQQQTATTTAARVALAAPTTFQTSLYFLCYNSILEIYARSALCIYKSLFVASYVLFPCLLLRKLMLFSLHLRQCFFVFFHLCFVCVIFSFCCCCCCSWRFFFAFIFVFALNLIRVLFYGRGFFAVVVVVYLLLLCAELT